MKTSLLSLLPVERAAPFLLLSFLFFLLLYHLYSLITDYHRGGRSGYGAGRELMGGELDCIAEGSRKTTCKGDPQGQLKRPRQNVNPVESVKTPVD
jgi:hypothetical protein